MKSIAIKIPKRLANVKFTCPSCEADHVLIKNSFGYRTIKDGDDFKWYCHKCKQFLRLMPISPLVLAAMKYSK